MPLSFSGFVVWTVLVGCLIYGLFLCLRSYIRFRKHYRFVKNFPAAPRHWLLGVLHEFPGPTEKGLTWINKHINECKEGFFVAWFGPFLATFCVFHPESVKLILKSSEPKPMHFGAYFNMHPWLGDGLLLANGKQWERNRRLLTPAFHFEILRPYMEINNRCTDILIRKFEQFAKTGEYFEVFNHISLLTLDIILRCAFSSDNDIQLNGESDPFVKATNSLAEIVIYRILSPWLHADFFFNLSSVGRQFNRDCRFVHGVANEVIKSRKEALARLGFESIKKHRCLDFLDILLTAKDADGQGLNNQEIRDETDTFLFEGHDTTSSGVSWALYSLAKYPEHLRLCQEEVDEVLRRKTNKDIEWDDTPKLKYLTMCIKESLRHHTTVPFIQRELTKDLSIGGSSVPAGTIIEIYLYGLHHNDKVWKDPEEYQPERFSAKNQELMDPFAFCPFSAGPRNCIGQDFAMHEMKTAIAKIIHRFDLSLHPTRNVKHRPALVMKSEDGIYMRVTPRKITEMNSCLTI